MNQLTVLSRDLYISFPLRYYLLAISKNHNTITISKSLTKLSIVYISVPKVQPSLTLHLAILPLAFVSFLTVRPGEGAISMI